MLYIVAVGGGGGGRRSTQRTAAPTMSSRPLSPAVAVLDGWADAAWSVNVVPNPANDVRKILRARNRRTVPAGHGLGHRQ